MMFLDYTPPGPVSGAFISDRSMVSGIMGPFGSGKTSSVIMKTVQIAAEQNPSKINGDRLFKWGVVRNTMTDLKRTTMKSIDNWFGTGGQWGGGGSSSEPPFFKINFQLPDRSIVRLWYEFVGLDTHNIEQLAKGWELSGYWMNEADQMPKDVKDMVDGRVSRYPGMMHNACSWAGGLLDYNAPDTEHWLYTLFEEQKPPSHRLFVQPGGRDPRAENLQNLSPGYYERMCIGKEDWWIRRNVDNLYGFSRDGKPVYLEYRDDFHCASEELQPVKSLVVRADFDQGLHPACVLRQIMPNGQLRILDELFSDSGAVDLCAQLRRLMGSEKYFGCRVIGGKCDPAASARSGNDTESWVDCVNRLMGWTGAERVTLAETNEPDKRQGAVRFRLKTNVDDGRPGLLISTTCRIARKGFNSEYKFKKQTQTGTAQYSDAPEKKFPYADIQDAIQYGALDDGGYYEVIGRVARTTRAHSMRPRTARVEVQL